MIHISSAGMSSDFINDLQFQEFLCGDLGELRFFPRGNDNPFPTWYILIELFPTLFLTQKQGTYGIPFCKTGLNQHRNFCVKGPFNFEGKNLHIPPGGKCHFLHD